MDDTNQNVAGKINSNDQVLVTTAGQGVGNSKQVQEQTLVQFPKSSAGSTPMPDDTVQATPSLPVAPSSQTATNDTADTDDTQIIGGWATKEREPLSSLSADVGEVISNPDTTVDLDPDVEAAGVEAVTPLPVVSDDAKAAGVELAKEANPVVPQVAAQQNKKPAVSREEAEEVIKKPLLFQNASDSDTWLKYLWLRYYMLLGKNGHE